MGDNIGAAVDAAIEARKTLLRKAAKGFRFKGTRKVKNNILNFHDRPAAAAKAGDAIPAGRTLRPFKTMLRTAREDIYNEENEFDEEGRLLARVFPERAAKIVAGKDTKAVALRRGLFVPLDLKGLKGWLDRQQAYFDGLSLRDKDIINSYTSHGDRLVNAYCRGRLGDVSELIREMAGDESVPMAHSFYDQFHIFQRKFPKDVIRKKEYYKDDAGDLDMGKIGEFFLTHIDFFGKGANIATMLEQYKNDLMKIIEGSPRLTSDLVVYRGIKTEEHVTSSEYKNIDFLSTTLDPFSVLQFTEKFEDELGGTTATFHCCVYEMTLHKSVPCMYMQFNSEYANEFEVLVPPGMNVRLDKEIQVKVKPSRREAAPRNLLDPYYNDSVLVVTADVRRPPPRKSRGKTLKIKFL